MNDEENPLNNQQDQQPLNQSEPLTVSQGVPPQSNIYDGPVAQTAQEKLEYSESFNSLNANQKKSHRGIKLLVIITAIVITVSAVFLLLGGSEDTNNSQQSDTDGSGFEQVIAEPEAEEESNVQQTAVPETEESAEEKKALNESVMQAQAEGRDTERRADGNAMFQYLETYFAENGFYPTEQFSSSLFPGSDPESFLDTNGVRVSQLSKLSTEKPESPFKPDVEPTGSEYSYIAYQCTSPLPGEGKCNKYLLSVWLETEDTIFIKESLN